jgi:hypothetical protein
MVLGGRSPREELDEAWRRAGARLSRPLDTKLGTGVVASAQVDRKLAQELGQ